MATIPTTPAATPYKPQTFAGAQPLNMKPFQPFADAAYKDATSRLDPQFAQARKTFEQDLINRGIGPGNEAYSNASESFERTRNDAYAGARNDALAQALAAQGQAYGQAADTFGRNQSERQFGAQFGEGQRQFDTSMGFNRERADMADLMALLGYGNDTTAQNNATLNSDMQRSLSLLGLIPGMTPTPLDAQGATNSWLNQYNSTLDRNSADRNARNNAYVQLASAFLS